jgi:peptide/nickel transport system permease protein/oligopeptide transport system permease protein
MSDDLRAVEVADGGVVADLPPQREDKPPADELAKTFQAARASRTLWGDAWYRLRRNKLALVALGWLVVLILTSASADLWAPRFLGKPNAIDTTKIAAERLLPPTAAHPMGTDDLGRDTLSRVIYGARISLTVGTLAVVVSVLIGMMLGALSGFYSGWLDALIMRFADVFLAFPYILFAILLLSVLPEDWRTSIWPVVITIGLLGWPSIARVFRSSILSVKENDYVDAGRALGASDLRLISRHIMPNAVAPIIVYATMSIGGAILTEAALSFLGLGILPDPVSNPNAVSWGRMIADGQMYLTSNPAIVLWPGIAILTTVLAFTLLGDGIRDALDVKMKD